ncbi:DUF1566 domain-containing protein [Aliiglaciecola sp. CAU 1673]|uniref:Lcl C-terminal domain-containing protein n=1 Tax=Aliiglaciecola sp. CAU 1673 TaxID=3032595 RepID=UPI0023DC3C12|nr:DUF1566 domain-containing protein [Aliiglaciecola sp. CAU 1673]MDF2177444.1 DUF1566 domain-containing protein [Aliiglaciecola sp. CAU 1673]
MKKRFSQLMWAMVLGCLGFMATAQTCLTTVTATTQSDVFVDNEDGTVTDTSTGLTWMRCSVGQSWDGENELCVGEASQLNWQQALQSAYGLEFAGLKGWRVPNVKELTSLVERQCVHPAINEEIFPNTPSDDFWSATPSMLDTQRAWTVAFYNGSNALKAKTLFPYVRLVTRR